MINIGICDDIPELCNILHNQLLTGNYTSLPCNISIYHNAQELLDARPELDLLFLDIEMPGMSGMELLQQHGALFENTRVAFLTSHTEFACQGYKVNAYRFLKKPVTDEDLEELFEKLEKTLLLHKPIKIGTQHNELTILLKDIVYIEAFKNGTYVVTKTNKWQSAMRLKEIFEMLPKTYFYQPHKSFIINMFQISQLMFKDCQLKMSDDSLIDIAHHKRKDFIEFYDNFRLHT